MQLLLSEKHADLTAPVAVAWETKKNLDLRLSSHNRSSHMLSRRRDLCIIQLLAALPPPPPPQKPRRGSNIELVSHPTPPHSAITSRSEQVGCMPRTRRSTCWDRQGCCSCCCQYCYALSATLQCEPVRGCVCAKAIAAGELETEG